MFALLATAIFFFTLEILSEILYFSCPGLQNSPSLSKNIFEYDPQKVYRLKKNIRGKFAGKPIMTNSWGYRDVEHAAYKERNTIRILALGDSVTFGHGITLRETYPKQLKRLMAKKLAVPIEVINTAVPGYSTFQEYFDLERGLAFQPDIVTIQFVLNDVAEPYFVYKRYGGRGIDYHRVEDTYWLDHWLADRSKLYLLLRKLFISMRFKTLDQRQVIRLALQQQIVWERDHAEASFTQNNKTKEAWRECLRWMKKVTDLCRKSNVDCILIISPVDFQMFDLSKTFPQKTLKAFAANQNIECLDLLPLIQEKARIQIIKKYSLPPDLSYADLTTNYSDDIKKVWRKYFLDNDHMTPKGHELVAKALYPYVHHLLIKKKPVPLR